MLMPTAVAEALIITSRCIPTIRPFQKPANSPVALSGSAKVLAGSLSIERSGTRPPKMAAQSSLPTRLILITTPKKQAITMPTMILSTHSKMRMPVEPLS